MIKKLTIGRNSQNDIVVNNPSVSSFHATIKYESDSLSTITEVARFEIIDNNSTNGTFVNGKKIKQYSLTVNDKVKVGNAVLNWQNHVTFEKEIISDIIETKTIGRSDNCNIIINRPNVSSVHAKLIKTKEGKTYIVDIKSTNGTYVNNKKIFQKELKKGDVVTLSKQHLVNWESSKNVARIEPKELIPHKQTINIKNISIAAGIIFILGFTTLFLKTRNSFEPSQDYKNSVVLIYHSYIYEVKVGNEIVHVTKNNGKLAMFNESTNSTIDITGTGFFISDDGKIITNRHVAMPWAYDNEMEEIKKAMQTSITESVESTEDLLWAVKNVSEIEVSGKTLFLGVGYNDTYINSVSDFDECILKRESGDPEIDVAYIQLKSKNTPTRIEKYIHLEDAITDYQSLKTGEYVYMLGYPAGFSVGNTKDGLKVNYQYGQLTREADNVSIGHNIPTIGGGSGSPIFDSKGRLVAINHAGLTNTQGFNFAIVAKHAVSLIE